MMRVGDETFDELTKSLATTVTRRRALKLFGGGVLTAGWAAVMGRGAAAAPNRCAVICSQFYRPGPAQAQCRQACRQCGGDVNRLCGLGSQVPVVCCPPESTCCTDFFSQAFCCPSGTICDASAGACLEECPPESGCLGPDCAPGCFCVTSVDGQTACVSFEFANCGATPCTTDADCGGGVCVDATECCGEPTAVCFPPEAFCTFGSEGARASSSSGTAAWSH
jgi:hypothetical protein